ncbi:hypothetical protein OG21DRAFT_1510619 [Imleria badia]|nr:hypothetical protein OG21DRAFT_1510619 [Imleria badia]
MPPMRTLWRLDIGGSQGPHEYILPDEPSRIRSSPLLPKVVVVQSHPSPSSLCNPKRTMGLYDTTIGALLVSILFNTFLYGLVTYQFAAYYRISK